MRRSVLYMICAGFCVLSGCAGASPRPDFSVLTHRSGGDLSESQRLVVQTARSLLGTPYRYGGSTPAGFDCSGFVTYVYRNAAALELPRMTHDLARSGRPVSVDQLRPADLVYFKIERQKPLHVGIYLGAGRFIHSPSSGGKVNVQRLDVEYWETRYLGARRVV